MLQSFCYWYSCHSVYFILLLGSGDGFASSLLSPPGQGGLSFPTSPCNLIPLCLPQKWATIFELQGVRQDLWRHPFTCPGTICTTQWRGNVLGRQELTKCNYGTFCYLVSKFMYYVCMHSLWTCSLLTISCKRSLPLQLPTRISGKYRTWEMSMWSIFGNVKAFWREFLEDLQAVLCKWTLGKCL